VTKIEHLDLAIGKLLRANMNLISSSEMIDVQQLSFELVKEQGNYVVITSDDRAVCDNISKIQIGTKDYNLSEVLSLRTGKYGYINWADKETKANHVDHGYVKVSLKYGNDLE
jgi:hypothetical protein